MQQTAIINVVGLSKRFLGEHTPFLTEWSKKKQVASIDPVLPAVTCSVQSTYLTGKWPNEHGIVGNGWYFREQDEVKLWRQSNKLVSGPNVWEQAKEKDSNFTCANMFWWYNKNSSVDFSVTPLPQYWADGSKKPDCYSQPAEIRDRLQEELGMFPLFNFWGPKTSIEASKWIADASKKVHDWHNPTMVLIYLPHLDYCLQKFGHDKSTLKKDLNEIDAVCKDLILFLEKKGVEVTLLSEYGITEVEQPIHINRVLREMGLLELREERGFELLDPGASRAFALADHQVSHIYVNDKTKIDEVKQRLEQVPGISKVLDEAGKKEYHIDHERAGELVAIANSKSWFTYYYWLDDSKAPDFARCVDIHNKPGYDPVEMFFDPKQLLIVPKIMFKLLKKKMGFRMLMDIIPLDASLVKGSHGRVDVSDEDKAIFIGNNSGGKANISPVDICGIMLDEVFGG
ncbi:MAG: alkaline phosphatase family protein [Flavobacteriales bacterium]|nr:alkaline phosphatase family protein [Flavobacteriales bacterium]